jgi:hypothetical protein
LGTLISKINTYPIGTGTRILIFFYIKILSSR